MSWCSYVLDHFPLQERSLAEAKDALKPGHSTCAGGPGPALKVSAVQRLQRVGLGESRPRPLLQACVMHAATPLAAATTEGDLSPIDYEPPPRHDYATTDPSRRTGEGHCELMDYRIEYFQSQDGACIAAARGGTGKPLVITPAFGNTIETQWATYVGAFTDHEIVTYDRRGTGLSERGSPCGEAEPYLQDAQAVVDGFGLDEFAVVGTLTGTIEATSLAARNTDRVTHLVLRAPVTGLADWAAMPAVSAALAALDHDWEFYTELFAQSVVGWGNPGGPQLAAQWRAVTTRDELRAMFDAFIGLDLTPMYPQIAAATLVEHHPGYFIPDSYSRRISSLIGDCQMTIYSGSGSDFPNDFSTASEFLTDDGLAEAPGTSGPQTILFTDMVSSTALTQRLGDDAAHTLLRRHNSTVRAALADHDGREIKHTGDGIMASFGSAVAAVTAALRIQTDLTGSEIGARIGLNAGEPIAEDGDLFGIAVQLAARITDRAKPGQVLVSHVVRDLCAGKQFTFEPVGEATLKGFSEPIALYHAHSS